MSGIFNSIECKSYVEKIKINSECCFVGSKNNRLIQRCKECKKQWKRPIEGLIEKFPSVYQFCNGNLNKLVLLLKKVFILMNAWIAGKNLVKPHYHLKKIFIVN